MFASFRSRAYLHDKGSNVVGREQFAKQRCFWFEIYIKSTSAMALVSQVSREIPDQAALSLDGAFSPQHWCF